MREVKIEKIFSGMPLGKIVDHINEAVNSDFTILKEHDNIRKWNCLPVLLIEEEDEQQKILTFIDYVDELMITPSEKYVYIITLASLIEHGKVNIKLLEDGPIFMLADYFKDKTIKEMSKMLPIVGHPKAIHMARFKTLEVDVRTEILEYIYRMYKAKRITKAHKEEFLDKLANEIYQEDYYKLLDIMRK